MDLDESAEASHRPLAPLASSETFSDGITTNHDDQKQQNTDLSLTNNEENALGEELNHKSTKSDFDSLEKLFDFSSSGISSETHLNNERSTQNNTRIRFSDTNQIFTTDQVFNFI